MTNTNLKKYEGVIPAFYACYDENGEVSPERVRALAQYHIDKGVQGFMSTDLLENVFILVLKIVS